MSGFDPSKFLAPELPLGGDARAPDEPVGRWRDADRPADVAGVAGASPTAGSLAVDAETGEILDGWAIGGGSVAGVAGVAATHDLPLTAPFARELNAMFSYPVPTYLRPGVWPRMCDAARKFAETKAEEALALGWEPIELFGVYRTPWRRSLAVDGLLWLAAARPIGKVEAHAIEILNKRGPHARAYRAHFMTRRFLSSLMWDAFHPSNRRPDDHHSSG